MCAIFVSFTYVDGQMRGVGVVFSRFLEVSVDLGVVIGMAMVFFYAVLGGMKGITYTQVAQYCILMFAYMVTAIFISILLTGHAIPSWACAAGRRDRHTDRGGEAVSLLAKLDAPHRAGLCALRRVKDLLTSSASPPRSWSARQACPT